MKKEAFTKVLFLITVLSLSLSVSAQNMKEAVKKAREAGMYGKVIDGKDAVDRAYERSRKKERIKELQRNGVSIENANSNKRAASSSSIGGAGRSKVRYNNSGSSYDGNYSSGTSNNSSSNSNFRQHLCVLASLHRSRSMYLNGFVPLLHMGNWSYYCYY